MKMRFSLALRNVFRNRRRTALNVLMIAGGVSALILFRGFSSRILFDLREITIKSHTGHVQLATRAFWDKAQVKPKEMLLEGFGELTERIRKLPHVISVSGRIGFYGLVSTGEHSFSAHGNTIDPVEEKEKFGTMRIIDGQRLSPDKPFQVLLGSGLAKTLRVKAGDSVTLLTYTYENVVNALDLEVVGIFRTGVSEFDDATFTLNLSAAQKLLDTEQVEQIVVGLDDTDHTEKVAADIRNLLASMNRPIVLKTWAQLSDYYHQCEAFFTTQNSVFAFIILTLVVLGVLNTIGMSIMERAGEIGTLRALGDTERAILKQFTLEGFLLGVVGAVTGTISGTVFAGILNLIQIPITVPGASVPLKVKIDLFFGSYFEGCCLAIAAATLAAFLPAMRASRMDIVDALRRNI